jgi:hypothetical protein
LYFGLECLVKHIELIMATLQVTLGVEMRPAPFLGFGCLFVPGLGIDFALH